MSKVENFETKIYSDEDGWKIWLVTDRTSWDKVTSYFKCQYPVAGTPRRDTRILEVPNYHHNISTLGTELAKRMYFIHMLVGPTNTRDEYSVKFTDIMMDSMSNGVMLKALREHNRKTLHQEHLLPGYQSSGKERSFVVYHDPVAATMAKVTFTETDEGYTTSFLCIGDVKGAMTKTEQTVTFMLRRPESISNELFRTLNPLLAKMQLDVDDRKDIVSEINEYFNKGRFAFWLTLAKLNNAQLVATK